ncbi:FCD domain-containing protein [Paenibacillus filicis]|uniref:FCD domain-containing protein n=1 Tax=Paenibacillus filicis TaxID=669464 RepID=A0ABU9DE93_9BACL
MTNSLQASRLEYAVLSYLSQSDIPVGATTLVLVVGKKFGLSQATLGRKLMQFDDEGYTNLQGRKGRVLTGAGRERLEELERELRQQSHHSRLLQALNTDSHEALLDVLIVRRALEYEAAALAAEKATPEDVELLRESIRLQREVLADNRIPYEEDRAFHLLIAKTSRNQVLLHALQLVWQESLDLPATASIRRSVGSELVVDHERIASAIAERSPCRAGQEMVRHINQIIGDVEQYFIRKHEDEEPVDVSTFIGGKEQ